MNNTKSTDAVLLLLTQDENKAFKGSRVVQPAKGAIYKSTSVPSLLCPQRFS